MQGYAHGTTILAWWQDALEGQLRLDTLKVGGVGVPKAVRHNDEQGRRTSAGEGMSEPTQHGMRNTCREPRKKWAYLVSPPVGLVF